MRANRVPVTLTVTEKAETAIKSGHPWVYDAEITNIDENPENGCLCDVFSQKKSWLGTGIYSQNSKIRVRLLTRNSNDICDEGFFYRRIKYALDYRKAVMGDDFSCCRLIFGEADGLPGVTADRYGDIIVTQILSYGMELRRDMLYSSLLRVMSEYGETILGIFERDDVPIRELEGLEQRKCWYGENHPQSTVTQITENGIIYNVDFENGQKTGFFLDQKYNRKAVAKLSKGKRVLDCFTHTGSFALNAAMGGAEKVTAVDVSKIALSQARENASLNSLTDKIEFVCADVFDLLTAYGEQKKRDFDFIILDPPAFTKSRKTIRNAEGGYREINYRAMKLLPRGGFLATCSCSHFMSDKLFCEMLVSAATEASVSLRQVEARQQSCDHPILWNVPETDYLKFYIFQVV